jgi:Peptidase A4 family
MTSGGDPPRVAAAASGEIAAARPSRGSRRGGTGGGARVVILVGLVTCVLVVAPASIGQTLAHRLSTTVAAHGAASSLLRPKMKTSPNWSGYVATAPAGKTLSYQSVTGTWTVPKAICVHGKPATWSTVWVGLGGYKETRQEEVGTDTNCNASGKPVYFAWFELVPFLSFPVTITGLVKILNPKLVELHLVDRTRGWSFTRKINWAINDTTTADWVVEAPAICRQASCFEASLSDFRTATMRDISAVAAGRTGTLADLSWQVIPIRLVPSSLTVPVISPIAISSGHRGKQGQATSPAGATPSSPSADGRSFSWTWQKVATHGI